MHQDIVYNKIVAKNVQTEQLLVMLTNQITIPFINFMNAIKICVPYFFRSAIFKEITIVCVTARLILIFIIIKRPLNLLDLLKFQKAMNFNFKLKIKIINFKPRTLIKTYCVWMSHLKYSFDIYFINNNILINVDYHKLD